MLGSTSGNAFPPTIPVLRCVEGIIPRQFHYSQVLADGLRPILPRSSSSSFSPRSPVQHLFGSSIRVHSGHMTQPRKSFPSDGAAQLLLCCSFLEQDRSPVLESRILRLKLKLDIKLYYC